MKVKSKKFRVSIVLVLCLSFVLGLMSPMQVEAAAATPAGSISGSITNNLLTAPVVQKNSSYSLGTRPIGWGHYGINTEGKHEFFMSYGNPETMFGSDLNGYNRYYITIDSAYPVYTATYAYVLNQGSVYQGSYQTYFVSKYAFNVSVNRMRGSASSHSFDSVLYRSGPANIQYLGGSSYFVYSFYNQYSWNVSSLPVFLLGVYNPHLEVFDTSADFSNYLAEIGVTQNNYFTYCFSKDLHVLAEQLDELGQVGGSGSSSGGDSGSSSGGSSGSGTGPSDQGWFDRVLNLFIDLPVNIAKALYDNELGKFIFGVPAEIVKLFAQSDLGKYIMRIPVEIYQQFREDGIFSVIENLAEDITTKINDSKLGRFIFGVPIAIVNAVEDSVLGTTIKDMYDAVKGFFVADGPAEAIKSIRTLLFDIPADLINGLIHTDFVQTVVSSGNELIDFLLDPLGAFGLDHSFLSDLIKFFADPLGVFGLNDRENNFISLAIQDAWNALIQPMIDFAVDLFVPDHNILQEYIDELSAKFPFIASCRNGVDLIISRLQSVADHGVVVPKINIPLSETFLSQHGVKDFVIDFAWFLPYRAGVLMFERGALFLMFTFRFYFNIKSVFTAASNSASAISTMYHNITYNP